MTDLKYDHLGYASCHGLWVGRRKHNGEPSEYWICVGDHPHDPDGDSTLLEGPRPKTEEEAIEQARAYRKKQLLEELRGLK